MNKIRTLKIKYLHKKRQIYKYKTIITIYFLSINVCRPQLFKIKVDFNNSIYFILLMYTKPVFEIFFILLCSCTNWFMKVRGEKNESLESI